MLFWLAAALCPFTPDAGFGFYQWSAAKPAQVINQTVTKLHELQAGLIRLYLGPRYDYRVPPLDAGRIRQEPAEMVLRGRFRRILEDSCIPTVVLTTYPGRDYGGGLDDISLNRPWSAEDRAAETKQLTDLAEALYTLAGDSDKTVIIANSEADARLLDIANYTGSLALAVENVAKWQRARYQAIARARVQHPRAKLRLLNAFEVSLVNLGIESVNGTFKATAAGKVNALREIVPRVPFDLLSYSAYESINSPYQTGVIDTAPGEIGIRLKRDLAVLRRATDKPVMIGELGFARDEFDGLKTGGVAARLKAALAALKQLRPAYTVLWQAFNGVSTEGEPDSFGLLEPGSETLELLQRR